ncbi:MAG: ABC transporter permease [Oscillospiraceae bacterium]|nr:ABC transporter permease [Oscillospiraceae bacterium]
MSDKTKAIRKRKKTFEDYTSLMSSLIAIAGGMLVALVVLMLSNPSTGWDGFKMLLLGGTPYGGVKSLGDMLYFATPIMCTGIALCLAFKTGVFNIGGPGQYIIGAYFAIWTAIKLDGQFTGALAWIIPVLVSMIVGAVWALVPGILRAYFNVNAVISTIMFNYIAMYYSVYWVRTYIYDQTRGQSLPVPAVSRLPKGFLAGLNSSADMGFFVAVLAAILVWVILDKTVLGFELKACGMNADACHYAGIKSKRSIMTAILLSGALCGLGGGLHYLASSGIYIKVVEQSAAEGFTGIAVACLANNNPIGAIFSALYMAFLTVGGQYMQLFGFQKEIVSVITGVVIYFSAFVLLLREKLNGAAAKVRLKRAASKEGGAEE